MCEKGYLVRQKDLQSIFEIVKKTNSWKDDSWDHVVNWNQFPTVPVVDPHNVGMVKLKNNRHLENYRQLQRAGYNKDKNTFCDVIIYCKRDSYIPCHRVVLMMSPLLNKLITDNIKEIGIPSKTNPISLVFPDFELDDMVQAVQLFYTNFSSFKNDNMLSVISILDFLKVREHLAAVQPYNPEADRKLGKRTIMRFQDLNQSDDDDDSDDDLMVRHTVKKNPSAPKINRTGDWVQQTVEQVETPPPENKSRSKKGHASSDASINSDDGKGNSSSSKKSKLPKDTASTRGGTKEGNRPGSSTSNPKKNRINEEGTKSKVDPKPVPHQPKEFIKVPPGQYTKKPTPRIRVGTHPEAIIPDPKPDETIQKQKPRRTIPATVTSSSSSHVIPSENAVSSSSKNQDVHEHKNTSYEHDEEYRPSPRELDSESEKEPNSDDSSPDGDDLHLIERGLVARNVAERIKMNPRRAKNKWQKEADQDDDEETNKRYPIRKNRATVNKYSPSKIVKVTSSTTTHVDKEPILLKPGVPVLSAKPTAICDSDSSDSDSEPEDAEKYLANSGSPFELKCFFCKHEFPSEDDLDVHFYKTCGHHLMNQYIYNPKTCLICKKGFKSLSHYGFARHINNCFTNPSNRGSIESNDNSKTEKKSENVQLLLPIIKIEKIDEPKAKPKAKAPTKKDAKVSISNEERVPIGETRVIMKRISISIIDAIKYQIKQGDKVDIPRIAGLNYVRAICVKRELPDFYPNDSEEMINQRIRELEREQEESRIESDLRYEAKKQKRREEKARAANNAKVPPLVLERSRFVKERKTNYNAQDVIAGFANSCSCTKGKHPSVRLALRCMKSRKRQKCWICNQELSMDHPLENHFRTIHFDLNHPGHIICPVCKLLVPYPDISAHMNDGHFGPDKTKKNQVAKPQKRKRKSLPLAKKPNRKRAKTTQIRPPSLSNSMEQSKLSSTIVAIEEESPKDDETLKNQNPNDKEGSDAINNTISLSEDTSIATLIPGGTNAPLTLNAVGNSVLKISALTTAPCSDSPMAKQIPNNNTQEASIPIRSINAATLLENIITQSVQDDTAFVSANRPRNTPSLVIAQENREPIPVEGITVPHNSSSLPQISYGGAITGIVSSQLSTNSDQHLQRNNNSQAIAIPSVSVPSTGTGNTVSYRLPNGATATFALNFSNVPNPLLPVGQRILSKPNQPTTRRPQQSQPTRINQIVGQSLQFGTNTSVSPRTPGVPTLTVVSRSEAPQIRPRQQQSFPSQQQVQTVSSHQANQITLNPLQQQQNLAIRQQQQNLAIAQQRQNSTTPQQLNLTIAQQQQQNVLIANRQQNISVQNQSSSVLEQNHSVSRQQHVQLQNHSTPQRQQQQHVVQLQTPAINQQQLSVHQPQLQQNLIATPQNSPFHQEQNASTATIRQRNVQLIQVSQPMALQQAQLQSLRIIPRKATDVPPVNTLATVSSIRPLQATPNTSTQDFSQLFNQLVAGDNSVGYTPRNIRGSNTASTGYNFLQNNFQINTQRENPNTHSSFIDEFLQSNSISTDESSFNQLIYGTSELRPPSPSRPRSPRLPCPECKMIFRTQDLLENHLC